MKRKLEKTVEDKFLASSLWSEKIIQECKDQNIFLTIRDNRLDLYHKGGKLFSFTNSGFKTHVKYASVISSSADYLTESELSVYKLASNFKSNYKRIKENCSNYSGVEASGVSDLYHKHSYLSGSDIVVLDIEISFESLNEEKSQDRIDIILYNKESRTIQFVEAKHFSNSEIWSTTTPKVIGQIKKYESQIANKKSEILLEYTEYIKVINRVFNKSISEPIEVEDKVTLLIFGFDTDQKNGRLKRLVTENKEYAGVKTYAKGDIKTIVPENLWKAGVL